MDKKKIRALQRTNYCFYKLTEKVYSLIQNIRYISGVKITNRGCAKLEKYIRGNHNNVVIGERSVLDNVKIHIVGNNNRIVFGKNCTIAKNCSFWMEGSDIEIRIGDNCSIQYSTHFLAQEDNVRIILGDDCMFSNRITIRTSDSHSIIDNKTGKRINPSGNVVIGNHVWIAAQAIILKGTTIGDSCIIGTRSIVTKNIPSNCLAVGAPARIVKEDVTWDRKRVSVE